AERPGLEHRLRAIRASLDRRPSLGLVGFRLPHAQGLRDEFGFHSMTSLCQRSRSWRDQEHRGCQTGERTNSGSWRSLTGSRASPRAAGPFVDVNCAAIPESLLEAEMFGFERGAFTEARQAKMGLFQAAHGGTIFLDEIGLLSEGLQGKLLKVVEDRAVRRLG